jgi:hypothetical protein
LLLSKDILHNFVDAVLECPASWKLIAGTVVECGECIALHRPAILPAILVDAQAPITKIARWEKSA